MRGLLEGYKSNIPIILLVFYALGYAYLFTYYSTFDISIQYYVSLSDLLFFTINSLITLAIVYLAVELGFHIVSVVILSVWFSKPLNSKIRGRIKNSNVYSRYYSLVVEKIIYRHARGLSFFLFVAAGFVVLFRSNDGLAIFSFYLPFLVVKLYNVTQTQNDEEKRRVMEGTIGVLCIVLVVSFLYQGFSDGKTVKVEGSEEHIEFWSDSVHYDTSLPELCFVGETSAYVFLYDQKQRETIVVSRSRASELKIHDRTLSPEEQEKRIEEFREKFHGFLRLLRPNSVNE